VDTTKIQADLEAFAVERDWQQFQWLTQEQSADLDDDSRQAVATEIADVQIYLLRLADKLGIDIEQAVTEKMEENRARYPADKVRGSAAKYTEYQD